MTKKSSSAAQNGSRQYMQTPMSVVAGMGATALTGHLPDPLPVIDQWVMNSRDYMEMKRKLNA